MVARSCSITDLVASIGVTGGVASLDSLDVADLKVDTLDVGALTVDELDRWAPVSCVRPSYPMVLVSSCPRTPVQYSSVTGRNQRRQ